MLKVLLHSPWPQEGSKLKFSMYNFSYGVPENRGAGTLEKYEGEQIRRISEKMGSDPSILFFGCTLFFEGPNP